MRSGVINRGLKIDDDQEEAPKYQKQTLDAGRKRSNFEKDMDDLLFGGGPRPARRQPKEQTTKPAQQTKVPTKPVQQIKKPAQNPNKSIEQPKVNPPIQPTQPSKPVEQKPNKSIQQNPNKSIQQNPNKSIQQKPKPNVPGSNTTIPSVRQIGLISKIDTNKKPQVKKDNYVAPEKHQEQIAEEVPEIIEQPKHHEEPNIAPEKPAQISNKSFNRPGYIRKLKKVAQDFNYANDNSKNHTATDVVRPVQCDKNRMKKLNDYDFIDHEFPPSSYSLGYRFKQVISEWKRPNQFVKNSVFGKYVDPNDINPGKLSSPQFLSTLSVLAEMEGNIKRLIEDQKANANGFYLIRLNINGVWRYVSVDNKLPFAEGQALGAQSFNDSQSELWVSLIEKAYAKAYSGYDVFSRSQPRQNYLRDLTGAPVRKYLASDSNLASIIKNAISSGHVVVAVPKQEIASLGLNPNYSLSVLNCKSTGGLELRNSWGTIQQKSKLNFSKQGVFELSANQAKDFISYIMIANTNDSYSTATIESKHKAGFYSSYSFKIKDQSSGFLSVSQWDQRFFPQGAYQYSPIRIILQKKHTDNSAIYVNSAFSFNSRNLDLEVHLTPGQYQVFVAAHWKSRQYDYDLTFNGKQKVSFKRIYTTKFPNSIAEALTKVNLQNGKRSALGHCNQYVLHHKESNLILITADNTSQKEYQFNQDFTKVNFGTLSLLNARDNQQSYDNLVGYQLEGAKNDANENRRWPVMIAPKGQFTWIISTNENYDPQNFRKWGFR